MQGQAALEQGAAVQFQLPLKVLEDAVQEAIRFDNEGVFRDAWESGFSV